jgi:hypothetical protein
MGIKRLLSKPIRHMRAYLLKRKLSNKDGRVILNDPFMKINVIKKKNAQFIVKGTLTFANYQKNSASVTIMLDKNSKLQIDGDLDIVNGSVFSVCEKRFS